MSTNDRLRKLYDDGLERFETELGVERIIKQSRDLRIFVFQNLVNEELKYKIQHNFKNVIDINSDPDSDTRFDDE
jgi:hypothetical protein